MTNTRGNPVRSRDARSSHSTCFEPRVRIFHKHLLVSVYAVLSIYAVTLALTHRVLWTCGRYGFVHNINVNEKHDDTVYLSIRCVLASVCTNAFSVVAVG